MDTVPEQPCELRRWLERIGLEDAEVLAVLDNTDLDQLDRDSVRLLHGLLEPAGSLSTLKGRMAAHRRHKRYSESPCGWRDSEC